MPRVVFLLTTFLILVEPALSQTSASQERDTLYSMALQASVLEMEKQWGHFDDSLNGERLRTDYRHMIVQKDTTITADMAEAFDNHTLEFLDDRSLIDRYRKLKKPFLILKIGALGNLGGGRLKILVSTCWFSYKNHNHLFFAYSDWSDVRLRFDCASKEFIIDSVTLGGI